MSVAHPTYYKGLLLNNLSDTKINYKAYYQDIILFGIDASTEEDTGSTVQQNNEIWYTSTDSATVTPYSATAIGTLTSNVYSDGKGVMTFSSDITTIGQSAFSGCSTLQTVTLPNSVTSIGARAFQNCTSLTSITIPDSVTIIDNYAFRGCTTLQTITLPDSVTSISSRAFQNCTSLTSVSIGSGITSIGSSAFTSATTLATITCNAATAPTIQANTFQYVATGGTLYYPSGSDYSQWLSTDTYYLGYYNWIDGNAQQNNEIWYTSTNSATVTPYDSTAIGTLVSNVYSDGKGVMTFEEDITTIGNEAFVMCEGLSSITLPDSVTSIGDYALNGCTSLASVTMGSSVTSIGYGAFAASTSLTSITLPDSVTSIGDGAFAYCEGLSSIDIGSGATSLGNEVFINCTSLSSITCRATTEPTIQASTFQDVATDGTLYYPSGSDYSTWLTYLEGYNWTGEEMTE